MELTTANTAIVLDSTADFPEAHERFPNWHVVPLYVHFGSESFRDGVDLSSPDFYDKLRAAPSIPTTSQPTPRDFLACYEQLQDAERVYSLHLASNLSGTFQSASTAAAEVGDDRVRTVDTRTVSAAITLLGLAIQRRLERGTTDEEIDALVERYTREHGVVFTVDTLEFLAKGGRIGRARAFAGTLMNVKPILAIRDGEVLPVKRVRGAQKAFQEFVEALESQTSDSSGLRIGIVHADAASRAEALQKLVADRRPQASVEVVSPLGAVVGAHAGPGAVGLFWFEDV